jgi:hypothetical protein
MARNKKRSADNKAFVMFDIVYEDGTLSSNRKVPSSTLNELDGDAPARAFIEAQDREIAEKSGRSRGRVKTIVRSAKQ